MLNLHGITQVIREHLIHVEAGQRKQGMAVQIHVAFSIIYSLAV